MDKKIGLLLSNWQKKNIEGFFCPDRAAALAKVLELVSRNASIGISGSATLNELNLVQLLEERGNKVFNQYKPGLTRGESMELRRQGSLADYYLASANAISQNGEMVFFSAYGNRISGISSSKTAIIICGINKITANLELAIKRAREYTTPLNCKRLNWQSACFSDGVCHNDICASPEYKRMCCQLLIIEAEAIPGRLKVILVGEKLGF